MAHRDGDDSSVADVAVLTSVFVWSPLCLGCLQFGIYDLQSRVTPSPFIITIVRQWKPLDAPARKASICSGVFVVLACDNVLEVDVYKNR